jgi:hypothetical protein
MLQTQQTAAAAAAAGDPVRCANFAGAAYAQRLQVAAAAVWPERAGSAGSAASGCLRRWLPQRAQQPTPRRRPHNQTLPPKPNC